VAVGSDAREDVVEHRDRDDGLCVWLAGQVGGHGTARAGGERRLGERRAGHSCWERNSIREDEKQDGESQETVRIGASCVELEIIWYSQLRRWAEPAYDRSWVDYTNDATQEVPEACAKDVGMVRVGEVKETHDCVYRKY